MRIFVIIAVALMPHIGWAFPDTYMGYKVTEKSFAIAGGKTIQVAITDAGAIPAEDDQFKIEVAGLEMVAMKNAPGAPAINWKFVFTAKSAKPLERVTIEEVSPSDPAILLAEDNAPQLKSTNWGSAWGTATKQVEATKDSTPWLYSPETSTFIFKFSIRTKDGEEHVLYQLARFPYGTKLQYVNYANQLRSNK